MDRSEIVRSLKPIDASSMLEELDYSNMPEPIAQVAEPQSFQLPAGLSSGRAAFLEALEQRSGNVLPAFTPPDPTTYFFLSSPKLVGDAPTYLMK